MRIVLATCIVCFSMRLDISNKTTNKTNMELIIYSPLTPGEDLLHLAWLWERLWTHTVSACNVQDNVMYQRLFCTRPPPLIVNYGKVKVIMGLQHLWYLSRVSSFIHYGL